VNSLYDKQVEEEGVEEDRPEEWALEWVKEQETLGAEDRGEEVFQTAIQTFQ
jgi:hypothetical protein